jgi:dTDP-4-amino-4,6-dideoxygalactose transaminase
MTSGRGRPAGAAPVGAEAESAAPGGDGPLPDRNVAADLRPDRSSTRRTVHDRIPFTDLAAMTREVRSEVDAAFARILDSGRFIGGEDVERFEQQWAAYCRTAHAVGVANGTDALQLALRALDIGTGDEVLVPTNTFVGTAEAVVLAGATPRFADVSPQTLLLTPVTLEAALSRRTRAVIVVHLYGQVADMDAIVRVAASAGVDVIEDAAQAQGASWRGRPAGSFGHVGCFSFYPAKNLGAFGDAGAIVTEDADLARRVRCMRDHGRSAGSHYEHRLLGTNSRMDTLQAAVLSVKLTRLEKWTAARRVLAGIYRAQLADGPVRLVEDLSGGGHGYHLLVARVRAREHARRRLLQAGIETGLHYPVPCHQLPPYARYPHGALPVAEQAAGEILSLPMFPHMTADQVSRVCQELQEAVAA